MRTTSAEKIKVMQAYEDGAELVDGRGNTYLKEECGELSWGWGTVQYSIKQKWYDNIPEGGVLSVVRDDGTEVARVAKVIKYNKSHVFPFETCTIGYTNANPLLPLEVEKLLVNSRSVVGL